MTAGTFYSYGVHIIKQDNVLEAMRERTDQGQRHGAGLAAKAYGIETVCSQREHILFASGQKERIATYWQLL